MKNTQIFVLLLLSLLCIAAVFSGCTASFTESDALQLSLSEPTESVMSLVGAFEAGEADNASGDVTQKAGSVCAGGACIIY